MRFPFRLAACVLAGMLALAPASRAAELRDGQHDFDFNFGTWHTHITRTTDPFAANSPTIELDGIVTVRKVWDGKAALEEIETDGPNGHWEGMTLFLYNPQAHQWSQTFVNSKVGVLAPGNVNIGGFKDGRVELYGQDTYQGRAIFVRAVWSEITAESHRYEESFSEDGGKTWQRSFLANLTRVKA